MPRKHIKAGIDRPRRVVDRAGRNVQAYLARAADQDRQEKHRGD